MKKWLRRKLQNFILENDSKESTAAGGILVANHSVGFLDKEAHEPIQFSVYNAQGGKILETRTYDKRASRWNTSLHVIENNENFGDNIGKIVFMEMLKKG